MIDQVYNPHLEIQVVEHCNLNCASCTHFSPLAEPRYITLEDFYKQLIETNRIFEGHCKSLKIMGGEPLLHPALDQLLLLARKAMPSTRLTVQTNGILLVKMPDSFWKACSENGVLIRVTRYPVKLDNAQIDALAHHFNVKLEYHPANGVEKSFNLYPLDIQGNGNVAENFMQCKMRKRYVLIKDNKLYPCPIAGNAEHFNSCFGTNLDCSDDNFMYINEVHSFEEFKEFAERAISFCKYCRSSEYKREIGWMRSQKKMSEWT